MKKTGIISILLSLILFGTAVYLEHSSKKHHSNYEALAQNAGKQLEDLENKSGRFISQFTRTPTPEPDKRLSYWHELNNRKPVEWLLVFIYQNDSLIWWSDNSAPAPGSDITEGIRFFYNGWYEFYTTGTRDIRVVGMLKVKNQYAYQNRFLSNEFHPCITLPSQVKITTEPDENSIPLKSRIKNHTVYLNFDKSVWVSQTPSTVSLLYIISYLLFLLSVFSFFKSVTNSSLKAGLGTVLAIVVTRISSVYYNFPASLYELPFFSPSYYASSFVLNSLGDLLVTSLVLTYLVSVFYRQRSVVMQGMLFQSWKKAAILIAGVTLFITLAYSVFINYLLSGLILNSRISFNINNVFELDLYSFAGVVIIGIMLFSFYMVCDVAARLVQKEIRTRAAMISLSLVTFLLFIALFLFIKTRFELFDAYGFKSFLITVFLIIFITSIRHYSRQLNVFTRYLLIIFGFSVYAAQAISEFNQLREKESRKLLAVKLENEQDQVAEYLFSDVALKISRDRIIASIFANPYDKMLASVAASDIIARRLSQFYFTGYWGKYDIEYKYFNAAGLPVNTGGDPSWNLDYFNAMIRMDGRETYSPDLYFTGNTSGRISYIGRIPVYDPDSPEIQTGTIIISLGSKPLQAEAGFPELLLSDKVPQKKDISNYSYAHYRNGNLVNQAGNYNYLVGSASYETLNDDRLHEQFVTFDHFSHYFYRTSNNGLLIVSTRSPGILEFITLFSYLFSFYGFSFVFISALRHIVNNNGRISVNFKNRIQATVVVIVVVTMLLIGGATVYYIYKNYVTNLGLNVNDKLKSMLIAIQDELSTRSLIESEITDEMNYTFSKLAGTLSIDFNIYSGNGMLIYSTQPKIYEQGLVARTMNMNALYNLSELNKSFYIQVEEIGSLRFLSAYEPVRNNNYQTVGYVNLPYFARQDELKKDISAFLVALINIYVLLFAFSVFITFIISNRITKPLQIIQQRLGKIKLGKSNELIDWDHDDEIGALVKEYNRMVEELSESAELLARSERESAWREMAKQVAHEIKNPLTPMKLSVQHLQRAWKDQSPNVDQIMQRFSQTLIEQIDTLSNIATEFSNFAKMPKANNETVDVAQILKSTVSLFSGNELSTITYYQHTSDPMLAFADKDQLRRVFSNLLKNALQSIPEDIHGHIHVEIKAADEQIVVSVKDNGSGIADNEKSRIFTPNFTTKTGGMGLGLAMVKNIVELSGGKVWFTSGLGQGSVFYVSLPALTATGQP